MTALLLAAALAIPTASPAPSPSAVPTEQPIAATIPCGWLVDRVKARHGGKDQRITADFVGELYAESLKLHGLAPKVGATAHASRLQFLAATADTLACFGL